MKFGWSNRKKKLYNDYNICEKLDCNLNEYLILNTARHIKILKKIIHWKKICSLKIHILIYSYFNLYYFKK